jgi:hypothetical protein
MIRYLSGVDTPGLRLAAFESDIGLLIQPGNSYHSVIEHYPFWGGDNGAFTTKAGGFKLGAYIAMITQPALQTHRANCLFINAPDCLTVLPDGSVIGDAAATLARFPLWGAVLRNLGFPVALVAQDGLETMLGRVPWDDFDVLFVGGSTEWKLGPGAALCVREAKQRGKRTHMGRVNSLKRLRIANNLGIDTADGTFIKYGPDVNLPRLLGWIRALKE